MNNTSLEVDCLNGALAERAIMNDHKIDWGNTRTVAAEKMTGSRRHLVSLIVQNTYNTVSRNDRCLTLIYAHTLQRLLKPI